MEEQFNFNSLENIKRLSIPERILIIEDIWESILNSKEDIPLSDKQKRELDERLERFSKNPDDVKPWNEVRNNIQSQL